MPVQMNGCKFNLHFKVCLVNPSPNLQEKWAFQPCFPWSIQKTLGPILWVTFLRITCLWVCREWLPLYKITKYKILYNVKIARSHWASPHLTFHSQWYPSQRWPYKLSDRGMFSHLGDFHCQWLRTWEFHALTACLTFMYRPEKKSSLSWCSFLLVSDPMGQRKPCLPDSRQLISE